MKLSGEIQNSASISLRDIYFYFRFVNYY